MYFMRHSPDEIAWHSRVLYYRPESNEPIVKARVTSEEEGVQVMVYTRDQKDLFVRLTGDNFYEKTLHKRVFIDFYDPM